VEAPGRPALVGHRDREPGRAVYVVDGERRGHRPERGGTREWEVAASERPRPRRAPGVRRARQERAGLRLADGRAPLPPQRRRRGFGAAAEDAGIEGVTLHDLRHAYGSRLASKGLSARQITDAMGHKKTATTEIYSQRFNGEQADERIREAMSG
jgi:integrase